MAETAIRKFTEVSPNNVTGWINLAAMQLLQNKRHDVFSSLQKAVEVGGEPVRNRLRQDSRFNSIRTSKEFQQLVPPVNPDGANIDFSSLLGI